MIPTANSISKPPVLHNTDQDSGANIPNKKLPKVQVILAGQSSAKLLESSSNLIDNIVARHIDFELSEDFKPVVSLKDFQAEIDALNQNLRILTSEQKPIPLTKLADRKNLHKLVSELQYLNSTFLDEDHLPSVHSGDARDLKNTDSLTIQLFSILAQNNTDEANYLTKAERNLYGMEDTDSFIEETFLSTQNQILNNLTTDPENPILQKLAQASIAILTVPRSEGSVFANFSPKSQKALRENQNLLFSGAEGNHSLVEDLNAIFKISTEPTFEKDEGIELKDRTPNEARELIIGFSLEELAEISVDEVPEVIEVSETDNLLAELKLSIAEGKRKFSLPKSAMNNTEEITELLAQFSEHAKKIFDESSSIEKDAFVNKLMPLILSSERNFLNKNQKTLFDKLNMSIRKYIFSEENKKNPRLKQLKKDLKTHSRTSAYKIVFPEDSRTVGLSPKEVVAKLILEPEARKKGLQSLLKPSIANFEEIAPINRLSRLTEKLGKLLGQKPKSIEAKTQLLEQVSKTISALDTSLKGSRYGEDLIPIDRFIVLKELSEQLKAILTDNKLREITTPYQISSLLDPNGSENESKATALESFDESFNPLSARIGALALKVQMRADQNKDPFVSSKMRSELKENLKFAVA